MILKVFTQPNCPKCPAAKALASKLLVNSCQLKVEEYDVSTVDGLAEASFYTVMATPSLLLCDDQGKEIHGWRGEVPTMANLKLKMQNAK
jgi:thioredoxin-related protein